jgi:hypothetical protein
MRGISIGGSMRPGRLLLSVLALGCLAHPASAVTLGFDDLAELDVIAAQYAGVGASFSGSPLVLRAGSLLNEFVLPPRSNPNVAFGAMGAVGVAFAPPVSYVSVYVSYLAPVVLTAFGADDEVLASVTSAFANNTPPSGGTGNELLEVSGTGITRVVIDGTAETFVFDDLTFDLAPTPAPEPAAVTLALMAAASGIARIRRRRGDDR